MDDFKDTDGSLSGTWFVGLEQQENSRRVLERQGGHYSTDVNNMEFCPIGVSRTD